MKGISLWNKATDLIIGGNSLLSKRPTRYCSSQWPTYYKEAKGIEIKDLNCISYKDFSEFSIGCNILGYRPKMHFKVLNYLRKSPPLTTLNSPMEVYLADKLNTFFSFDNVWRFTRGGGEALALACRYARAISTKSNVLSLGYHGWHDWYLSANLISNQGLDKVFLTGLDPFGIHKNLSGTSFSCSPNSPLDISQAITDFDIGIVFIESARYELLPSESVAILKNFQDNHGIIVSDEVTSGFRFPRKLACLELDISPDIVVLGKALGGGWPLSAIGVKNSYKSICEDVFASSTFWSEQSGFIASSLFLDTIADWDKFYSNLAACGSLLRNAFIYAMDGKNIKFSINSIPTMISHSCQFGDFSQRESSAILCYRMLKENYLYSTTSYVSAAHTPSNIKRFSLFLSKCVDSILYDMQHDSDILTNELALFGYLEVGFSRTQKL